VKDTTVYFNKLVKSDKQVVFDMEVSNVGLRRFLMCEKTNERVFASDEGRITRRGREDVQNTRRLVRVGRIATTYYDKRGNITT
jgi:hypothetical protein